MASLNFKLESDAWGLRTDLSMGSGYLGKSDVWGAMAMPYFNVTDKLQLVGRYTYVTSDDVNGVRIATYENAIVPGRGNPTTRLRRRELLLLRSQAEGADGRAVCRHEDRAGDGGAYSGTSWVTGIRMGWP